MKMLKIGTPVILLKQRVLDVLTPKTVFNAGLQMIIYCTNKNGTYDLIDTEGRRLNEVGRDLFKTAK